MSAAELAILVLALTSGDADSTRGATAGATIRRDAFAALAATLVVRTSWDLRTVGIASANGFAANVGETVAVGVFRTIREPNAAVTTTTGALFLGQSQTGDCTGKCYTSDCSANAAKSCTTTDLLIGQGFGDVFEPVCHRHLLVGCVGGTNAVLQHVVPQCTEFASSIQSNKNLTIDPYKQELVTGR
jgi:hypothetical protein